MDPTLIDPTSEHYDIYMASKSKIWLNIPGWLIRSILYVVLWTAFLIWIKRTTKRLDETNGDRKVYSKLYTRSVLFIVTFALTSATMSWDWIMALEPHWYSTIFMWYGMVSYLVAAVSIMAMISIYLKRKGSLPLFNDNHQHNLAKYMFFFCLFLVFFWFFYFI